MADFVYNIAMGRFAEFANRVDQNDPANAVLVVTAFLTTATDATLRDLDTLALIEADANSAEATNSGYARLVLDDTDVAAVAADDTNDRMDIDLADFAWTSVATSPGAWSDIIVCYDSDSTGGTDTNIIPCLQADFSVTPDGSNITATLNAAGIFRAS